MQSNNWYDCVVCYVWVNQMNCYLHHEYSLLVCLNITFCILKFRDSNNKCYCFALFSLLIVKKVIYL